MLVGWIGPEAHSGWQKSHHSSLIYSVEGMHVLACADGLGLVTSSRGPKVHH